MSNHPLMLNGLILGMLLVASLIGFVLKWRVGFSTPHGVIDNLNARIKAWWVMAFVMGGSLAIGHGAVILLFLGISFFALREFLTLAPTRTADHYALLAAFYLILPLQYYFISVGWYGLFSVFIPVYGFLLLPILATLGNDTQQFLTRASSVQWGLMIAVYCISCIPALMVLDIPGYQNNNLLLINWLILVVQSSDVLQYVCGKLFGKRFLFCSILRGFFGMEARILQHQNAAFGQCIDYRLLSLAGIGQPDGHSQQFFQIDRNRLHLMFAGNVSFFIKRLTVLSRFFCSFL